MSDLTSIQAVKDWLKRWRGYLDDDMITRMQIGTKDIPAFAPDRGKWMKNEGRYGWHCSICGKDNVYAFVLDSDTSENNLQDYYCPNCGAQMERSNDATD